MTHLLSAEIELRVASEQDIEAALNKYYGGAKKEIDGGQREFQDVIQELTKDNVEIKADDGGEVEADAPIIRLVNQIIVEAFKVRASDIHLEPLEKTFRLRYRIDGMMHGDENPAEAVASRRSSPFENPGRHGHRRTAHPAGRAHPDQGRRQADRLARVVPADQSRRKHRDAYFGQGRFATGLAGTRIFDATTSRRSNASIALPDGILLVTGPTGSGKTTTLYSCLNFINRPDRKIITVEDPVEYILAGINQVQVNDIVGLDVSPRALRAMLRQAPNVIMLGEIRDLETASIAINASLTGHLVFSTLHTNDAPGAVTRLIDIGVKPFLVASSTRCLMAQRLVRKICKKCAAPYEPTDAEMRSLGLNASECRRTRTFKRQGLRRLQQDRQPRALWHL